jgi:protein-S-isoprenylcysteine O-methyltransferase Ste14
MTMTLIKRSVQWLKKRAEREYGKKQRLAAILLGGFFFWIVAPVFTIIGSYYLDQWLNLPRLSFEPIQIFTALLFMVTGWLFANWTIKVQYSLGRGTPAPVMPTQKLIVEKPYTYCRNPMTLGTALFYLGVAVGLGSLSALALALIYPVGILIYVKLIEEKELEARFGSEYVEYKRNTSFLIPHFWKKR